MTPAAGTLADIDATACRVAELLLRLEAADLSLTPPDFRLQPIAVLDTGGAFDPHKRTGVSRADGFVVAFLNGVRDILTIRECRLITAALDEGQPFAGAEDLANEFRRAQLKAVHRAGVIGGEPVWTLAPSPAPGGPVLS